MFLVCPGIRCEIILTCLAHILKTLSYSSLSAPCLNPSLYTILFNASIGNILLGGGDGHAPPKSRSSTIPLGKIDASSHTFVKLVFWHAITTNGATCKLPCTTEVATEL